MRTCLFLTTIAAFYCFATTAVSAADKDDLLRALIFHCSFDDTTDVNLFTAQGDGWIYTADSAARKNVRQGNYRKDVSIAKGAGRYGDCLRFKGKSKQVLFYKATPDMFYPRPNWSGAVSFWLKLDPDKDLPKGFCDPLQITANKWNDAAFFVDFDKTLPRDFRLGVFSNYARWNPKDTKWEDVPESDRPLVTVKKPPFSRDKWTHVAFSFTDINPKDGAGSTAQLYLNGELQGEIKKPLHFEWAKPNAAQGELGAVIMLGINYVGDFDDLIIFRRGLTAEEIGVLYRLPDGI